MSIIPVNARAQFTWQLTRQWRVLMLVWKPTQGGLFQKALESNFEISDVAPLAFCGKSWTFWPCTRWAILFYKWSFSFTWTCSKTFFGSHCFMWKELAVSFMNSACATFSSRILVVVRFAVDSSNNAEWWWLFHSWTWLNFEVSLI